MTFPSSWPPSMLAFAASASAEASYSTYAKPRERLTARSICSFPDHSLTSCHALPISSLRFERTRPPISCFEWLLLPSTPLTPRGGRWAGGTQISSCAAAAEGHALPQRTCTSAVLILPNVAKISEMCSVVTLRVSLPTLSLVALRSAAGFSLPFAASVAAFAGSTVLAAEDGLAADFSAAVPFDGSSPLLAREDVRADGLSASAFGALPLDPFSTAFCGGAGSEPLLVLQEASPRATSDALDGRGQTALGSR